MVNFKMLFESTRGKADIVPSAHAIARGLADDGGLFVPQSFPPVRLVDIKAMVGKSYVERAADVMGRYLTDFTGDELMECVEGAYRTGKFDSLKIAPLREVNYNTAVLELWHGLTAAFKDMALQILPRLLTKSMAKTGALYKTAILVATSGDTGKAALEGFADVPGTYIIVFYPADGVSEIQKRQMATQKGKNVSVFGVKGNFDDTQKGVKDIFSDKEMAERIAKDGYAFSSANSINFGRLVPQIAYYFSAYADAIEKGFAKPGELLNFVVPTGNFANILAGYYAKEMGLPAARLICASNSNNILTDFINTGVYDRRREFYRTMSPSMDILISSNLERLLYLVTGKKPERVRSFMEKLAEDGVYEINSEELEKVHGGFFAAWVDELETKETIGRIFSDYGYLMDPHTAVAWRSLEKYRLFTGDDTCSIVLSTASPYKFCDSVLPAIERDWKEKDGADPMELLRELSQKTGIKAPLNLLALERLPVIHTGVIEKEDMAQAVLQSLNIKE